MATEVQTEDYRALLSRSLETIKRLTAELEAGKGAREPVAVLGMGLRLPGGCGDPDTFWEFLRRGGDGVVEVPADRWRVEDHYEPDAEAPGKIYLREAGFLREDVSRFDAHFFGISPREAAETDPQQRLLLEAAWEALERAGIAPEAIRGSRTGVFVGQIGSEYAGLPRAERFGNPYTLTGSMSNITSGRLSYVLGVHGPSLSVDTACSSSLVAVHLACESLGRGESDLALAGGVNLLLAPDGFASLCDMRALSKDGRCKSFDADGDGYGRGEGCGVVVLKRLSDAVRDRDPVLAVIRGTGVNQDGPGSGLTVPNGSAQRALLRATLEAAGVRPAEVGYFEAHGTGTALGDPIEFQAIADVYGDDPQRAAPLLVGSVKSNIGHLEGAAGVAGLIKLVLCLQHGQVPPNLHLSTLNPKIRPADVPAEVPRRLTAWPPGGGPRIAALSSFGFSGTNAHAIVEQAPAPLPEPAPEAEERPLHVLTLSARSAGALDALVDAYRRTLQAPDAPSLPDACHTANTGRSHFAHRLAFVAADAAGAARLLSEAARARDGGPESGGRARRQAPKPAFLFNGRGDRRLASRLLHTQPAFRAAALACDAEARALTGGGILDDWQRAGDPPARPGAPGGREALLDAFCLQYGLLAMWRSWGVRPRAVLGRGSGELVAACAAGVMDLRTALGFLTGVAAGTEGRLSSPELRILSAARGGALSRTDALSAAHWSGAADAGTRPDAGIDELFALGCDAYIGIGAEAPDDAMAARLVSADPLHVPFPSAAEPWDGLAHALAALYGAGLDVDWAGFDRGYRRRRVPLPTYPFQRKRYWIEAAATPAPPAAVAAALPARAPDAVPEAPTARAAGGSAGAGGDPLDGTILASPLRETQVAYTLTVGAVPDVRATHGVLHAGYYLEMLARAARRAYGRGCTVGSLAFVSALLLREEGDNTVVLTLDRQAGDEVAFAFHYRADPDGGWSRHAQGTLTLGEGESAPRPARDLARLRAGLPAEVSGEDFYARAARERRLELGEQVRWISELRLGECQALARFAPPRSADPAPAWETGLPPGVFDACAQLFHAALPSEVPPDMRFMVTEWRGVQWAAAAGARELWCHAEVDGFDAAAGELRGRFTLLDAAGTELARIAAGTMKGLGAQHDLVFQQLSAPASEGAADAGGEASETVHRLAETPAGDRPRVLEEYLRGCFADLMAMEPGELDVEEPLGELGLDSLVGVTAKKVLDSELGIRLPLAVLIEGPSIRDLAAAVLPMITLVARPAKRPDTEAGAGPASAGRAAHEEPTRWIALRKRNPAARFKLFCFPYGRGRGASVFRDWQRLLPAEIEVCPIQLPGKESRVKERAFEDITAAVDALSEALAPELDRPYALYGHSVGGLLAYRLAHRLWETRPDKPHHLFVGAYSAPPVHPNPMITLTRRMFKEIGYDDIPAPDDLLTVDDAERERILDVLTSEADLSGELARLLLPSRLAELKLVQSFRYDGARFDVPVTAFHGLRDDRVDTAHMQAWREVTDGEFTLHLVSGDHLFLSEDQDQRLLLHHIQRGLGLG